MDLRFMADEPSAAERAVIARLIDPVESRNGQVVRGGHAARGHRHLLLPALAAVQSEMGWVSRGALNEISRRLLVPPAEAYGVASFYALISTEPRPAEVTHICDDIACRQAGGLDLLSKRNGDGVLTSPCLGQCDRRPAMFIQRAGGADEVRVEGPPATVQAGPLLRRVGLVDPTSLTDFQREGGFEGLVRAREMGAEQVVAEVKKSGLKGRGGAAFPTGVKWEAVAAEPAPRYLVCNADESEPGTFKDRVVMEGDPFGVVEAMAIAAFATGCEKAYIYIRGEYPLAASRLTAAIAASQEAGWLGGVDVQVFRGQGAYICGEETALFNSIEGFRGEPRQKPPFPAQAGLFGRPTVINNVETLINIPAIVLGGGAAYAAVGTPDSTGTRLFCLSGDLVRPGTYEIEMGRTLGELIDLAGGFVGDPQAILLGGAAGFFIGSDYLSMPMTFEDARARGVTLGSGVVMVFNHDRDMRDIVRRVARFFRDESCGQCVPCRVGTVRIEEAVARAHSGPMDRPLIADLDRAMKDASICGLGHTAASVVQSALAMGLI
ncbi:MAG TPA: NADH-ubiquinone oxidoreductase-F iron-sulfur binding region domain-containing protein [Acidimicrobiia bacterium]|nr:NADH-ubiquinone oxidoreductase-F iron-sulfur binding region domain-containing protein [Acidimicrobiia bacterium]